MASLARASVLVTLVLACSEPEVATLAEPGVDTSTGSTGPTPTSGEDVPTGVTETTLDPSTAATFDPPTSSTGGDDTTSSTGPAPSTTGTSSGETGGSSEGGGEDTSTGEPACVSFSCSPELDEVLCDGSPVEACQPGTYCVDDTCQELTQCEAAALLKRSEGCDFWAVKTELTSLAAGACFAAFVANTGTTSAHLGLEYQGAALDVATFARIPKGQGPSLTLEPYDAAVGLPVGEVAILFLSRGPGNYPKCPIASAVEAETQIVGTGRGQAFNITSDVPVAAYQTQPFGGGSGAVTAASLLLPTSVWDTSYVSVSPGPGTDAGTPLLTIIADSDGTHVTLRPKVPVIGSPTVLGGPAGQPIVYTLKRGEALQINQTKELTGSLLTADRPFAVFGGSTCLKLPAGVNACDGAHQQIPPIRALGHAYAGVRYRDRSPQVDETPPWRLVGAADGTTLSYWPAKPLGAPDTLERGQLAEFATAGPFLVTSQDSEHPFYASAFMTGGAPFNGAGDPDWVNLIPVEQYQDHYVFFTDPTYSETELVVVRSAVDGKFADVNLDCAATPLVAWKSLGDGLEWTRVQLVTGNFKKVGNCANGRREMTSDNPFGVTVWGWGSAASELFYTRYVSYAYPAGATIRQINDVVIPQ
ncbi:MAG: IgGFc-binding protein [Myxococcales bacterium]|nr:IgGFc-binding protein [Myxococcales bacterium]